MMLDSEGYLLSLTNITTKNGTILVFNGLMQCCFFLTNWFHMLVVSLPYFGEQVKFYRAFGIEDKKKKKRVN